jgi:DNA-binding beta-propeller fold protein YncE
MRKDWSQMRSILPPAARRRSRGPIAAALTVAVAATLGAALPAGAASSSITFVGLLAGPAVSDMYPVDVVDFGASYYVVDPGRYSVFKVNRATGQVVDSVGGHQGRGDGQLGAARAISVDAAGNVYVADTPNNRVEVFSPDLTYLSKWGTIGTGPGQFTMVYGITVGIGTGQGGAPDTEVVYTTDGSRVQKFTTGGTFISQFGQGHLNQPRQLAVDPATHNVYVVSARDRAIVVFNEDGVELFRFGSEGTGNGQFMGDIRGVDVAVFDNDSYVFVSDDGNHRVQIFNASGGYLGQFGNTGTPSDNKYLTDARGLTVTADGLVCVADEWDYGLKEYHLQFAGNGAPNGAAFDRLMFGGAAGAPGFNAPRGIAVNENTGAIYAVDWWNQRVEKFASDGTYQTKWGQRGTKTEPGSINFAWDAAVNPANGNVYVANRESHEIEVFDADGTYVTRWGYRGTTTGKFTFPQGVAFDSSGPGNPTLLVADSGNGRVQRFRILASGKGSFMAAYGTKGAGPGQFATPTGIDVATDGTIWVADTQNNRIQRRNPITGNWTTYTIANGLGLGFKSPWGVTVAPDGRIWVADTGRDRIVQMTAAGDLVAFADKTTPGVVSMDAPFEVAFGTDGAIYVSVVWDNKIMELTEAP